MNLMPKAGAGMVTLLVALATGALSAWPMAGGDGSAVVRLSWRTDPIRVEECRPLSEEEQARLPAHMRRTEECTGDSVDYELRVSFGGEEFVDTVAPSGLRRDRPVYVLRNHPVPPGAHSVAVTFTALLPEEVPSPDRPARLTWSGRMELEAGEVGLITLDESGRTLLRSGGDHGGGAS
jgi:hypothetical protein